jgi:hypothetical protein
MGDDAVTLARRYFEAINGHDLQAVRAFRAPSYIHHSGAGDLDPARLEPPAAEA